MKATRSVFSCWFRLRDRTRLKNSTVSSSGEQAVVVQVRRRVLDAAERERFDRAVGRGLAAVDHGFWLEESLRLQVVHQVVGVVRRRVAGRALALAEEDLLAALLAFGRLRRVELAEEVELRGRWEVEEFLELGHEVDLAAAFERVNALLGGVAMGSPSK